MTEKKDVLEEVEKQYEKNLKESNVDYDISEWGSFVVDYSNEPILYLWDNGQDIDPQESEDDPATLAAEMVEREEYLNNLFETRNKFIQEVLELEKLWPNLTDYDYETCKLDLCDLTYFFIPNVEKQIVYIS